MFPPVNITVYYIFLFRLENAKLFYYNNLSLTYVLYQRTLKNGIQNIKRSPEELLIDSDLLKDEYIGCHPCVNTSTLKIRTKYITDIFLPAVNHSFTAVTLGEADK